MKNRDGQISGEWGLGRWLLLGVFGIVLAVGIAIVAGSLASQPIGLSGEPVSAGSALEPAQDTSPAPDAKSKKGEQGSKPDSGTSSNTGTASPPVTSPPVTVPPEATPPAAAGTRDDYSGTGAVVPKSESGESAGGEGGGGADDD
ncbi:MAG: hypothetical protein JJE13_00470 [Thermoleophilia bacterium]|nr:hypothetical protein [Thermoleophilia bacterium]